MDGGRRCGILSRMDTEEKVRIEVERSIQRSVDETSCAIRSLLAGRGIYALNLISSPGSGKTTLIEALLSRFEGKGGVAVIEGDLETEIDAERIRKHGVQVLQINTRSGCHIQPSQLLNALKEMDLSETRLLIVENVGNLVCPAEVPLGEDKRIVLLSVTEGDEKPLKYPLIFKTSDILVVTKTDLLPYVKFDVGRVRRAARIANPAVEIFELSAVTGEGMNAFLDRIESFRAAKGTGA
ncbi:MAG: hypB [Deltaproteobacteria bacterium]|nr:hypB [Deltaproteobacteria bacterium]